MVHQPEEVLLNMNDWCKEHHGKSGLTQRVRGSSTTMAQAEDAVLAFITNYVPDAKRAQLAGNSVHNDRVFLMKYMPKWVQELGGCWCWCCAVLPGAHGLLFLSAWLLHSLDDLLVLDFSCCGCSCFALHLPAPPAPHRKHVCATAGHVAQPWSLGQHAAALSTWAQHCL